MPQVKLFGLSIQGAYAWLGIFIQMVLLLSLVLFNVELSSWKSTIGK